MSRLRQILRSQLGRSAGIFFAANVIGAAIPFLLLPVLTRYLSTEDYGIITMFQVLVGMTVPFIGINAHGAITRQYYRRDELDFPQYVGNALLILTGSTVIFGSITLLAADFIEVWTDFPGNWLWSIIVMAAASFLVAMRGALWRVEGKPIPYGIFFISLTAVELALALWLIVGRGMNWEGRVISRTAITGAFAILGLALLYRRGLIRLRFKPEYVRHALRFGAPLIPHTLGMWAITMTDRIFVTNMVNVAETGLYAAGAQIAMILNLVIAGFTSAWTPYLYERLQRNDPDELRQVVRITYAAGASFLIVGLVLGLGAPPLMKYFLGPEFEDAGKFVLLLAMGNVSFGGYRLAVDYLFFEERTRVIASITATTAALNFFGNWLLIDLNGSIGAAQATFAAYTCSMVLVWIAAAKARPMPWNLLR